MGDSYPNKAQFGDAFRVPFAHMQFDMLSASYRQENGELRQFSVGAASNYLCWRVSCSLAVFYDPEKSEGIRTMTGTVIIDDG